MLQHGGLSWFGGLFAGTLGGWYYIRKAHLPLYETLDLLAPFAALGQSIGRIGCFLNGCCYGKVSERFGLYSQVQGLSLIPTQIYSSILLLAIFIILRLLQERKHSPGRVFASYLILDSIQRFFIEFWRGDHGVLFAGLNAFQIFSIIALCIGIFLYRLTTAKR
jgi:phosphatidylglycerol---prolipoprotein diacylglyceryl transferase